PRGGALRALAIPRFWAMAKPFLSSNEVSHHPLVHLPTSTVVPFGISVRTSLSVPGAFRRLVSVVRVTGLAVALAADTRVKMAADAAIRTKLMAVLLFPSIVAHPPMALFNSSRASAFKISR